VESLRTSRRGRERLADLVGAGQATKVGSFSGTALVMKKLMGCGGACAGCCASARNAPAIDSVMVATIS